MEQDGGLLKIIFLNTWEVVIDLWHGREPKLAVLLFASAAVPISRVN